MHERLVDPLNQIHVIQPFSSRNRKDPLFTLNAQVTLNLHTRIPTHCPSTQSHDQPSPEAIPTTLWILRYACPPLLITRPVCPLDPRTISQCAFGPRCGRAVLRVSLRTDNAKQLWWGCHKKEGSLARRILPLASPHPFRPVAPNKQPIYLPGSGCVSFPIGGRSANYEQAFVITKFGGGGVGGGGGLGG